MLPDTVYGVLKGGSFHALEDVWAFDVADGVSNDGVFHVDGILRVLRHTRRLQRQHLRCTYARFDRRPGTNRILKVLRPLFSTVR